MKNILMVTLLVTTISLSCFAKTTPPNAVTTAFKQKFPTALNIIWGKENVHEYEAEFTENGIKHSANFSDKGEWLETETPVDFNSLPQKVKTNFIAQHKNAKMKEVSKIEKSDTTVIYEIEIKIGIKTKDCLYKTDGTNAN
jgi:hypothetical protein